MIVPMTNSLYLILESIAKTILELFDLEFSLLSLSLFVFFDNLDLKVS